MTDKPQRLRELAIARQQARWPGYHNLAEYHEGVYECDWVSPYSKTAGNINALVFILLQDWASDDYLAGPLDQDALRLGHTADRDTNVNLKRLLRQTFGLELHEVFGTNLFPFIKAGAMSAAIPRSDLVRAAREFALPQVKIVAPALVICLGVVTFDAVRRASGVTPCRTLADSIDSPFTLEHSRVWCQAHTGRLGQLNRGRDRAAADWLRMRADVFGEGTVVA